MKNQKDAKEPPKTDSYRFGAARNLKKKSKNCQSRHDISGLKDSGNLGFYLIVNAFAIFYWTCAYISYWNYHNDLLPIGERQSSAFDRGSRSSSVSQNI